MRALQSTYKDAKGRTRPTQTWYVEFRDHLEMPRRVAGFHDRKATEALGRNIEKLAWCKADGGTLDPVLTRWVEGLSPYLRRKLAAFGILDAGKVAALRPLAEHIDGGADAPGWRQFLSAKGNTPKHIGLFCGRVKRAFGECGMVFWSDLSATKIMAYLDGLRQDKHDEKGELVKGGLSAAGFNGYVKAALGFARWMVREGRATENPLAGLRKVNERVDRRRERRALSVDELRWPLDTTRNAAERFGMSGRARSMLYELAVETGLRSNELRSLTRAAPVKESARMEATNNLQAAPDAPRCPRTSDHAPGGQDGRSRPGDGGRTADDKADPRLSFCLALPGSIHHASSRNGAVGTGKGDSEKTPENKGESRVFRDLSPLGELGLEPRTYALKVRCSAN